MNYIWILSYSTVYCSNNYIRLHFKNKIYHIIVFVIKFLISISFKCTPNTYSLLECWILNCQFGISILLYVHFPLYWCFWHKKINQIISLQSRLIRAWKDCQIGHNGTCRSSILQSVAGWLSRGQSCLITYFHKY